MSILQIKDLIHQYITYGEKEEETQTINAVNGVDMSVEKGSSLPFLDTTAPANLPWQNISTDCCSPHPALSV